MKTLITKPQAGLSGNENYFSVLFTPSHILPQHTTIKSLTRPVNTMKTLYIFFVLITANLSAQDWLPLEVGNKWLHISTLKNYHTGEYTSSIFIDSVKEKIVINNLNYYRVTGNIYRYDRDSLILYRRAGDIDQLVIDFSKNAGYAYFNYIGPCAIIQGYESLFHSTHFYKGFDYSYYYGYGSYHYVQNIGNSYYFDRVIAMTYDQEVTRRLIEVILIDSTGSTHHSYNYYPDIILTPVTGISNSNFELNFTVNHSHSQNNLNFIDSVIMYSHYSKEDSIISNLPVIAVYQPGNNKNYHILTQLNIELLKSGYSFKYRFTAKDKHLIPKYDFSPDTGYYTAVWDTLAGIVNEIRDLHNHHLFQNYPNPFNPVTSIQYAIGNRQDVIIKIYDILGKEIVTLINEEKDAGYYQVEFDAAKYNLASGVYFCELKLNNVTSNKIKMIYLK